MATDNFREDVSVAFREFVQRNKGKRPSVLKVPYEDAMIWHVAASARESVSPKIEDFVAKTVNWYVHTLPLNHQPLEDCSAVLLAVDSGEKIHFE
jgi:hypothetical protein